MSQERSLLKEFETYACAILAAIILLMAFTNYIIKYEVIIYQTVVSLFSICLARSFSKSGDVKISNLAWIAAGTTIIGFAVYSIVKLESLKGNGEVDLIINLATLIWAPIGAGFVVTPIMNIPSHIGNQGNISTSQMPMPTISASTSPVSPPATPRPSQPNMPQTSLHAETASGTGEIGTQRN